MQLFLLIVVTITLIYGKSMKTPMKSTKSVKGTTKNRKIIIPVKREPLSLKVKKSVNILVDTLKTTTKQATNKLNKFNRSLKGYFASDFEVLLLRLTSPDSQRPNEDDIERLLATSECFVRNLDMTSASNPYRVTLRKINAKLCEKHVFTVWKAFYLLHLLLQHSISEDAMIYKQLIEKMSHEYNRKQKCKAFDVQRIARRLARDQEQQSQVAFVSSYGDYVITRAKLFTGQFQEMEGINDRMRAVDIVTQVHSSDCPSLV